MNNYARFYNEDCGAAGGKEELLAKLKQVVGDDKDHVNHARAVTDFRDVMKLGDYVFAKKGQTTYIAVGRVTGDYFFDASRPNYQQCRKIDWFKVETHELSDTKSARKTLTDITPWPDFVEKLAAAFGLTVAEGGDEGVVAPKDLLDVALRLFRECRGRDDGRHYWETENAAREWFADFTAEKLIDNFAYFQKNMIWSARVRMQITADYDHVSELAQLLADLKDNPRAIDYYAAKDYYAELQKCPGIGRGTVLDMLMKLHPESYGAYNKMMRDSLVYLGLVPEETEDAIRSDVYRLVMGQYETIRQKMIRMEIHRTPKDEVDPDFMTVNEFLWFVDDNKDLIKEKVMAKEFKKVEKKPKTGTKKLSDAMQEGLMLRLAAALRTKPFAILAGHSGTGKSQMVRRLAYMTCVDDALMDEAKTRNAPGNYCMIQVKPNWHDSTELLGYYSEIGRKFRTTDFVRFVMKAYAYPDIPFFVCLDEMNLAPVEHYFAEYLSAIESASVKNGEFLTDPLLPSDYDADQVADTDVCRFSESKAWYEKHGLTIPKNLFVVGTVNMDDTTNQFSRKVLDRAMTILMDQVKFEDMMDGAKGAEPNAADLLQAGDIAEFLKGKLRSDPLTTHQVALLNAVEGVLGKTAFAVAYRFANEYALYEASLVALTGKPDDENLAKTAMDHCVLMKVLPRVHGEKKDLVELFRGDAGKNVKGLEDTLAVADTLSGKKMEEILGRKANYLSFWP